MNLPVHGKLVSEPFELCGLCAQALRKVILRRLHDSRGKWGHFSGPPLPFPYPCPLLFLHLSRNTPRVLSVAGRPCHSHALGDGRRYDSTPAWAMAVGARQWFERPRLTSFNLSNLPQHTEPHAMSHN